MEVLKNIKMYIYILKCYRFTFSHKESLKATVIVCKYSLINIFHVSLPIIHFGCIHKQRTYLKLTKLFFCPLLKQGHHGKQCSLMRIWLFLWSSVKFQCIKGPENAMKYQTQWSPNFISFGDHVKAARFPNCPVHSLSNDTF